MQQTGKVVAYHRVSTKAQGVSGLGLEAQREAVEQYARSRTATVLASFTEVESGKKNNRPELAKALSLTRLSGATLVIAKLDRLSRDAAFLLTLQNTGVKFVAADMPDANELTVGIMALVAQQERQAISRRTTEALAAAKRRGQRLGNPHGAQALRRAQRGNQAALEAIAIRTKEWRASLMPIIDQLRAAGFTTLRQLADQLTAQGIQTSRGGRWHPATVARILNHTG